MKAWTEGIEMGELIFWAVCYLVGGIGGLLVGGVVMVAWVVVSYILEAVR